MNISLWLGPPLFELFLTTSTMIDLPKNVTSSEYQPFQYKTGRFDVINIFTSQDGCAGTVHGVYDRLATTGNECGGHLNSASYVFTHRTTYCWWLWIGEPSASEIVPHTPIAISPVPRMLWNSCRELPTAAARYIFTASRDHENSPFLLKPLLNSHLLRSPTSIYLPPGMD